MLTVLTSPRPYMQITHGATTKVEASTYDQIKTQIYDYIESRIWDSLDTPVWLQIREAIGETDAN